MSTDFERILTKDGRIGCITNEIKYSVLKRGQNITSQTFNAISGSTSAHAFNTAVPSLETITSREVLQSTDFTLRVDVTDTRRINQVSLYVCSQLRRNKCAGPVPSASARKYDDVCNK